MENRIVARKAEPGDLACVTALFADAVRQMNENGIRQWDEIYPNPEVLADDIRKREMYLTEIGGRVASVFVLNRECDPDYRNGSWKHSDSYTVLHRLCVSVAFQNRGVGKRTMELIEQMLRGRGVRAVRLDTFSQNPYALRLYEKLGFRKVGEARWRKGLFYLFEKEL